MGNLQVTSVSSKGQVVIPTEIREKMGITSGSKLVVVTDGNNLLLKPIESPKMSEFKELVKYSRRLAKKAGLKKKDLDSTIKAVRRESRS